MGYLDIVYTEKNLYDKYDFLNIFRISQWLILFLLPSVGSM